jgi:hypothetical protein
MCHDSGEVQFVRIIVWKHYEGKPEAHLPTCIATDYLSYHCAAAAAAL